ncbi:hypothetical protein DFH08DRAFT_823081 [Mycena albidolilacea]|uniref:Novel STAND NTPase 1 domain-containing protein n=1 Tax=Mycena albidolilacea TaxID=1033008 RepID=A0AAD6Z720_9AGAR|nr:hypothetical protein DFH08DRAFT_823081 [Mycena albidolilacea]
MPRQPTITENHLHNIAVCLTATLTLLNELNNAFNPPFIQPISSIMLALIDALQVMTVEIAYPSYLLDLAESETNLHVKSETTGFLPPSMLDHIGEFMETLHKIYTFIEGQQEGNKIKQLLRHRLDTAIEVFGIGTGVAMFNNIGDYKKATKLMHEEFLELIETLHDSSTISDGSSVYLDANKLTNSSNSFSMLPSTPKIFYGRESELNSIMEMLSQQSPRIAILGGGGMGKTSLARVVLHHPNIFNKFEDQFFVSAESTTMELAALIGLHVGLNLGKNLTKTLIQYFLTRTSCLLILDNLETIWEPIQSRGAIEEFLSLLTEVENLALIITMRGAERPAKTFMDITDNIYAIEDINQLLQFTDNMPPAVDLTAHLVDCEGLSNVLTRWENEKTALLSMGYDRKSNLDTSISLSVSSPRITPDSKELLSLLSILPNGLSDAELVQSKLPISHVLRCKAALQATSLAYQDSNKRLMLMMPSLCKHFYALLELYQKYNGEQLQPVIKQITLNLANLQEVLQRGLCRGDPNLSDTIYCALALNSFYQDTGRGDALSLLDNIQPVLPQPCDHHLEICFITEALRTDKHYITLVLDQMLARAKAHFQHVNDPLLEYTPQAMQCYDKALELSKSCQDPSQQCSVLIGIAWRKCRAGEYCTAQVYANEAQTLSKLSADLIPQAKAYRVGAVSSRFLGEYQESMTQLHRAKQIICICGLSGGFLDHRITLDQAEIHLLKSEYAQAKSIFCKIVETTSHHENTFSYALSLLNIAHVDILIGGNPEDVHQNLNKARKILSSTNYQGINSLCDMVEAEMELREGNFELAKTKFLECLHSGGEIDNSVQSFCLECLANIKTWLTPEWHLKWPVIYLAFAYKSQEKLALHKALLFLGDVFADTNNENTAFNLYTVALKGFIQMDIHHSRAQCILGLGDLANKRRDIPAAIVHWKAAQVLFQWSLQAKDVADIDSRLEIAGRAHQELETLPLCMQLSIHDQK